MRFRAMNTDVTVIAERDEAQVAAQVEQIFADAEQRFSRFRADSELSRLNRSTEPMIVSAQMFDALVTAKRYVELTDGIFEPAIGAALVALGYDRSFAAGALDRDSAGSAPRTASLLDVELDATCRIVTRPGGVQIDLGGIVKGRTVDAAAAVLPRRGAIDAGGDQVLRGSEGWLVGIEDPRDAERTIATLRVRDGAVATSAANRRRWRVQRAQRHHIVDPRTLGSAESDLVQVTVLAPTAELADVLAKTVFVLGSAAGPLLLDRWADVAAVLVPAQGEPLVYGELEVVS